jgi:ABC-type protease/lipase transport system fused ATPase/permease subunit
MRMSTLKMLSILSISLLISTGLLACERKGTAQKVGEKIDTSVEQAKDKVQDVVNPKGPMEKAGENIDETVDKTKEAVKN